MSKPRTKRRNVFACVDCQVDTQDIGEYYVVGADVWASVDMKKHGGMLCISCLELRLGRELASSDFSDAPVNHEEWAWTRFYDKQSEQLASRLSAEGRK